jgi:hypothetical protein
VTDAADRLGVSPRTRQRLAVRYVDLTPAEMIGAAAGRTPHNASV